MAGDDGAANEDGPTQADIGYTLNYNVTTDRLSHAAKGLSIEYPAYRWNFWPNEKPNPIELNKTSDVVTSIAYCTPRFPKRKTVYCSKIAHRTLRSRVTSSI